jgi:hypothetical protein
MNWYYLFSCECKEIPFHHYEPSCPYTNIYHSFKIIVFSYTLCFCEKHNQLLPIVLQIIFLLTSQFRFLQSPVAFKNGSENSIHRGRAFRHKSIKYLDFSLRGKNKISEKSNSVITKWQPANALILRPHFPPPHMALVVTTHLGFYEIERDTSRAVGPLKPS